MRPSIPKSCKCKTCQEYRNGANDAYYYAPYSIGYAFKDRMSGDPKDNARRMGFRVYKDVTLHREETIRREIYLREP